MDKTLIRKRFARATGSYLQTASVQRTIAERMVDRISVYVPEADQHKILEVGCGTGMFTRMYLQQYSPEQLFLNDICPEVQTCFPDLPEGKVDFLMGDAEKLCFPLNLDMIVSCSAIQWFEHPVAFLSRCARFLKPEGFLAFSTFGKMNMQEIASVSSVSLNYLSLEELKRELEPHYHLVYSHEEVFRLSFESPMAVLKHLKETGVTGIRSGVWTRGKLDAFCMHYSSRYASEGGMVPLTYHPIYIICQLKK